MGHSMLLCFLYPSLAAELDVRSLMTMQLIEMHTLVGIDPQSMTKGNALKFAQFVNDDKHTGNVCAWKGVQCDTDMQVRTIIWQTGQIFNNAKLEWIPRAVSYCAIEDCKLNTKILTRSLPARLVICKFNSCGLIGTVELRTLPQNISTLQMMNNHLIGVIRLTCLPETITFIKLSQNPIDTLIVANRSLPKSLAMATFSQPNLKKVNVVVLDSSDSDARIRNGSKYV